MEERAAAARALASDAVLTLHDEALLLEDGDHALSVRVLRFLCPRFVHGTALVMTADSIRLGTAWLSLVEAPIIADMLCREPRLVCDEHDWSRQVGVTTTAWIDDDGLKIAFKLLVDSSDAQTLVEDVRAGRKDRVGMGLFPDGTVEFSFLRESRCAGARVLSISE